MLTSSSARSASSYLLSASSSRPALARLSPSRAKISPSVIGRPSGCRSGAASDARILRVGESARTHTLWEGHVGRVARERIAPATRLRSERVSPSERDEGSATGFRVPRPAPSPPRPASRSAARSDARVEFSTLNRRARLPPRPWNIRKYDFSSRWTRKRPEPAASRFPDVRAEPPARTRTRPVDRRARRVVVLQFRASSDLRFPRGRASTTRPPGIPEFVHRPPPAPSPLAMSWVFEHPNAKGVLLPGQTKCHTGRLVPRVDPRDPLADPFEPEHCPKLCSPTGEFPPDPSEEADGKENDDDNAARAKKPLKSGALPLESSRERLTGCAPCGCALKWSCCGACCGACTVWSRDGFLAPDEEDAGERRPPVAAP